MNGIPFDKKTGDFHPLALCKDGSRNKAFKYYKRHVCRKDAEDEEQKKEVREVARNLVAPSARGYTVPMFLQAVFPQRKTQDAKRVTETSRGETIAIVSPDGLPYGKNARLIMAYITTQAAHNAFRLNRGEMTQEQALRIPLGASMAEFIRAIGFKTGTAHYSRVREQILRIVKTQVTVSTDDGERAQGKNTGFVESWNFWLGVDAPEQGSEDSHLVLTEEFFKVVSESHIPINLDVLWSLRTARSMDVYMWLTVKQYWLTRSKLNEYTFAWSAIEASFADISLSDSGKRRDFRRRFKDSVKHIEDAWPNAGISATPSGVTLTATAPSVPIKDKKK